MTTGFPEGPVTILFTDVEGSTDLRTRRGDVAAQEVLREHERLVRSCVGDHGGREVKGLGDGFMVAFASVRRALACASAIQQALEEHRRKSPASAVRVRIGLNTGEVFDDGGDLYGQAVNAAARIAARADPGEILVSDVTRRLAGSGPEFDFVDRGRVSLKGFPDRWHLYGLVWEPSDRRPQAARPGTQVRYVGRDTELEILGRLLDDARAGTTRFVGIEGEAGMGKSRLLDELVALPAAAGFAVHRARAEELQPRPFGLLADAFTIDARSSDPGRVALAELLDGDPDGGGEPADRRYRVIEAVINLVERAAIAGPVLAVFDDVHWADPSSIQALHMLCRRLDHLPVMVVVACRPLPRPPELTRFLDGVAEAGGPHFALDPLRADAVSALAASRLEADPGPVLRARLGGAAGNPLFVLELLEALFEEGTIRVEASVAETTSTVEPPPSLRLTILRRLAFLGPEELELLRRASLFGGSFSAAQLALVTDRSLLDVLSKLEEPIAAGFVTASGGTFAFRHDVVREALYLELPVAVRKALHLHIGRTLAATGAPAAEVANHLALGAEFGDREAVGWLRRAARELRSRAPTMAVQLLERATSLVAEQDPEWASLAREEVRLLGVAGRVREAEALAQKVLVQIPGRQDGFKLAFVQLELLFLQSRFGEATELAEQLLGLPSLPAEVRAEVMTHSMIARLIRGDIDGAQAAMVDLRPFVDAHPISLPAAYSSLLRGYIARGQGFAQQGVDHIEAGLAFEGRHRLAQVTLYLGAFQHGADRFDEAEATLHRAREELERLGYAALMQEYHWYMAVLHFTTGRWDDALAEVATTRQLTEGTGASGVRATVAGNPSPLIHLHRGDLAAAASALATVEADPALRDVVLARATWLEPMRALVQDGAGRAEEASGTLEVWRESVLGLTFLPDYRGFPRALVRLLRSQGHHQSLPDIVEEAEEAARRADGVPSVTGTALLLRGMVHNDTEALVEAVEAFRTSRRPFECAEACAAAGISLLSDGRDRDGQALVTEAFDLYGELGAQRAEAALAAEVRGFGIRRGTRGRRQRPLTGWAALTETESRIVALVAEGLTNGEIGDRLYTSRGTVATHLRSVFRKLEVSSRAELAADAARQPT